MQGKFTDCSYYVNSIAVISKERRPKHTYIAYFLMHIPYTEKQGRKPT